jgi:NodT family efflux transporter outer membrane factor (OMF) lipoprotein
MFHCKCFIFSIGLTLALSGCAVGPDFHSPPSPLTDSYTASPLPAKTVSVRGSVAGKSQYLKPGENIPAQWWVLFHSPELNFLIVQAIANNPNLAAAQAALRQAQENYRAEVGFLFPTITSQLTVERERFAGSTFGQNTPGSTFNLYNPSINGTYTVDVFGAIRRQMEALAAQVTFQRFELEAAYLTLTANIVTTVVTEASLRGQIRATYELIGLQRQILDITQKQFKLGAVGGSAVLTQQTQLAQTLATLPALQKSLAQTRHALAVLVGTLPSYYHLPPFEFSDLHLPANLPISCPSELVRQRPDVQASEALLHEASAQIGVATANLLPQFILTGSYGSVANQWSSLFKKNTITWNYAAQVVQTLFDAGTLSAQRRAAIAAYEQAAAQYKQTVLEAFQNVADVLKAVEFDAYNLRAQVEAERSARNNLALTRKQFKLGAVNYLALLTAENQYQQIRIARVQAEALRYSDTAALFQSLGGGWWNRGFLPNPARKENVVVRVLEEIL